MVAERERGGPYADAGELASRSGVGRDALERLAWAGACDASAGAGSAGARRSWRLGAVGAWRGGSVPGGTSSRCRSRRRRRRALRELTPWERLVADYASTGMTLGEHPMALLRDELGEGVVASAALGRLRDGSEVGSRGW